MTKKRFVAIGVEWSDGFIQDHIGDRDLFNIGAVCNLLNELSDENEQLKKDRNDLFIRERDTGNNCRKLKYENKQLKEDKQSLIDFIKKEFPKSHKHILEGIGND